MKSFIETFFKIKENNTNLAKESYAGLISFFSMAYIVSVYPSSLAEVGIPFSAAVTSTVLVCFFASLTMGIYARNPLIMGPALGVNVFFVHVMIVKLGFSYEVALGATFWSGVLFLILSVFKIREFIFRLIPLVIKQSLTVGIGMMITLIGFRQVGFFSPSSTSFIQVSPFSLETIWFILALGITFFIFLKKIKGSFFLSILLITVFSIPFGRWFDTSVLVEFNGVMSFPDFSLIGRINFVDSLHWSVFPSLLSLAFVDLSESFGTLMSLLESFKLSEENSQKNPVRHQMDSVKISDDLSQKGSQKKQVRRLKESLISDALGTIYSSFFGVSSATTYIESAAGLQAGGKTGFCTLVTACLFLPFLFLSPLLSMIPPVATAPVLILVGLCILNPIKDISWEKLDIAFPAFLVMILIPLTFSITTGLVCGCVSYFLIRLFHKEFK